MSGSSSHSTPKSYPEEEDIETIIWPKIKREDADDVVFPHMCIRGEHMTSSDAHTTRARARSSPAKVTLPSRTHQTSSPFVGSRYHPSATTSHSRKSSLSSIFGGLVPFTPLEGNKAVSQYARSASQSPEESERAQGSMERVEGLVQPAGDSAVTSMPETQAVADPVYPVTELSIIPHDTAQLASQGTQADTSLSATLPPLTTPPPHSLVPSSQPEQHVHNSGVEAQPLTLAPVVCASDPSGGSFKPGVLSASPSLPISQLEHGLHDSSHAPTQPPTSTPPAGHKEASAPYEIPAALSGSPASSTLSQPDEIDKIIDPMKAYLRSIHDSYRQRFNEMTREHEALRNSHEELTQHCRALKNSYDNLNTKVTGLEDWKSMVSERLNL